MVEGNRAERRANIKASGRSRRTRKAKARGVRQVRDVVPVVELTAERIAVAEAVGLIPPAA
jgi:hypothetical protein